MSKYKVITYTMVTAIGMGTAFPANAGKWDLFKMFGRDAKKAAPEVAGETVTHADGVVAGKSAIKINEILYWEDSFQKETSGLFKSIKERITSGHYFNTLGRDSAIDDLIAQTNTLGRDLIALEGSEGSGKTQTLIGLQERIQSGRVPDLLKNAHIVELNSSHKALNDFQELDSLFAKLSSKLTKDTGMVIIAISDVSRFLTQDATKNKSFDAILEMATRKIGVGRVKFVIEGTEGQITKMSEAFRSAKGAARVTLHGLSTLQAMEVAKNLAYRLKTEAKVKIEISQDVLDKVVQFAEIHLSNIGMPKSVVNLILGARALRDTTLSAIVSPLSAELRSVRENLVREQTKLNGLKGAYARERLAEIPLAIRGLDEEIAQIDVRFNALKAAQKELAQNLAQLKELSAKGQGSSTAGEQAAARAEVLKKQINQVTEDELALWISKETGKPIEEILLKAMTIEDLEKDLAKNFVGQEHAKLLALKAARRAKHLIRTTEKPIFSFLLVGPPGTGKTELMRILARFQGKLYRWDMAEFKEKHKIASLLGSPPGYSGSQDTAGIDKHGQMVTAMQENPHALGLLDEIDLAHPDFWDILYGLLDAGRVTSGMGVTGDATNWMFGLTTNLAAERLLAEQAKKGSPLTKKEMSDIIIAEGALRGLEIKPAVLNRIDEIVLFNPLDHSQYTKIANKEVMKLRDELSKHLRGIDVDDEALERIMRPFHNQGVNARDINRLVQDQITDKVNVLISGNAREAGLNTDFVFAEGDKLLVRVDKQTGDLKFTIQSPNDMVNDMQKALDEMKLQ